MRAIGRLFAAILVADILATAGLIGTGWLGDKFFPSKPITITGSESGVPLAVLVPALPAIAGFAAAVWLVMWAVSKGGFPADDAR